MWRSAATLIPAALVAACAGTPIETPVVGRTSTGEAMQGTATVVIGEKPGVFMVQAPSGLSCRGAFDDETPVKTIVIDVTCNDGRTGTVVSTRDASNAKGTAIAELSDGMRAEFIWGVISAEEQARFLSRSRIVAE